MCSDPTLALEPGISELVAHLQRTPQTPQSREDVCLPFNILATK